MIQNYANGHLSYTFVGTTLCDERSKLSVDEDDWCLEAMSGVMQRESGELLIGWNGIQPPGIPFSDLKLATGEWIGVFRHKSNPNEFLISCDPFGHLPVFYSWDSRRGVDYLFVSSSPSAIAQARIDSGFTATIDWQEFLPRLSSPHVLLNSRDSNVTYGKDVRALGAGERLHVSPGKARIGRCDFFNPPAGKSYDSLLDDGIERAISALSVAKKESDFRQKRFFLSGGKDSRMMLSLVCAGDLSQEFVVSTVDPSTWSNVKARSALTRDLEISAHLKDRIGMAWAPRLKRPQFPISFSESVFEWQSFRSNLNYYFPGASSFAIVEDVDLELRGAGGEIFRDYGSSYFTRAATFMDSRFESNCLETGVADMVEDLFRFSHCEPELTNLAKSGMREYLLEFSTLGAENAHDIAGMFHAVNRNPSHFGHVRHSIAHGNVELFPLEQPEFVWASRMLESSERSAGKLLFDVIERTCPWLNEVEFESGPWDTSAFSGVDASRAELIGSTKVGRVDIGKFKSALSVGSAGDPATPERVLYSPPSRWRPRFTELCVNELKACLSELRQLDGGREFLTDKFVYSLSRYASKHGSFAPFLMAKARSARDHVMGQRAAHTRVVPLDVPFGAADQVRFFGAPVKSDHVLLRSCPVSGQYELVIKALARGLRVECIELEGSESPVDVAFEVFAGGNRVATSWYARRNVEVFEIKEDWTGEIAVKCHVRLTGAQFPFCELESTVKP